MKKIGVVLSSLCVLTAVAADRAAELKGEIERLRTAYAAENKPLGIPDEFGVFVLTAEGKRIEKLEEELRKLNGETAPASAAALAAGWGMIPLGAPGDLKTATTFKNQPTLGKAPVRKSGLKLFGGGVVPTVTVASGDKYAAKLADEFAWHLSQMCGKEIGVAKAPSAKGPNVIFSTETGDKERAIVRREGNTLFVSGVAAGLGHATTYVLEALGCRYVWPGPTGKIIPKKAEIVLPEIALDFSPALKIRGVRAGARGMKKGDRGYESLVKLGFEPSAFAKRRAAAQVDRPGNRGFWQWHGVNDSTSVNGYFSEEARYSWGHYFADYPAKYAKAHPEWFALQPDGRRVKEKMARPCFCMSNRALADETAKNLIADFRKRPSAIGLSACLPDGGHDSMCLCEECRKLDPVNAPPLRFSVYYPTHRSFPYVSRTDRVFEFFNRIAAGVTAELPDKKICVYAYSSYTLPPVKVAPHPALVILSVAGSYTALSARNSARENLAAWSGFGNPLLWRPNALAGFKGFLPQNFARLLFADMELFKVNGLIGTDFDCMGGSWAPKGLVNYMLARSFLNPDHLDYDTIYADYLKAAFGPAAGVMRTWFDNLERYADEVAARTVDPMDRGARAASYRSTFDLAAYQALLAKAEAAAKGRPDVLRRLGLYRTGLEYAAWDLRKATFKGGKKARADLQRAYYDFIHAKTESPDDLVAVNPSGIGFHDSFLRPYLLQRLKTNEKESK